MTILCKPALEAMLLYMNRNNKRTKGSLRWVITKFESEYERVTLEPRFDHSTAAHFTDVMSE